MGGEGIYGIYGDRDRELPKVTKVLIEGRGVLAADVAAQATAWLWQGRIPRGAITLLDGDYNDVCL